MILVPDLFSKRLRGFIIGYWVERQRKFKKGKTRAGQLFSIKESVQLVFGDKYQFFVRFSFERRFSTTSDFIWGGGDLAKPFRHFLSEGNKMKNIPCSYCGFTFPFDWLVSKKAVTVGDHNFCSEMCADRHIRREVRQEFPKHNPPARSEFLAKLREFIYDSQTQNPHPPPSLQTG